jgi:hypothetical protein
MYFQMYRASLTMHSCLRNTEDLIDDTKELGLEVKAGKSKYMLMSRHQNAGQNHNITIAHKSFENVA